jgi:archaetidylinositol phosphate synthase
MRVAAGPLVALRVPPALLTAAGVLVAALVPFVAGFGSDSSLRLAAVLVGLAGLLDGLDGAVAVRSRRTSAGGAVLDAVADRVSDLLLVLALWAAGAPGQVCAAAAACASLHEYLREALRANGFRSVMAITVAERPTRIIVVAAFLLALRPVAGAWVLLGVGAAGLVQLAVVSLLALRPGRPGAP